MNKDEILREKWVFHGRWKEKPITVSYWRLNKKSDKKEYQKYNSFVVTLLNLKGDNYIPKSQAKNTISVTRKIIETDFDFFKSLFFDIEKVLNRYRKVCSGKKDAEKFLIFLKESREIFFFWDILSQLNKGITYYLEEESKKFKDINYFDYISITKDTILTKEYKDFKKLFVLFKKKSPEFEESLKSYLDKYEFAGTHCFLGLHQTKESVLDKLKTFELKEEKKAEIKKDKFYETYKKILKVASDVAYHRMLIAETFDEISYQFWDFLKSFAKKYNMDFEEITHYTYPELIDLIKEGKTVDRNSLKQRQKDFGMIKEGDRVYIILNDELNELIEKLSSKEIPTVMKGTIAFKGYVKGITKIIKSIDEFDKIKKGDVLVSFETTPDYVIAMGKAAAFVTEQGGITSHAAIISREMRKPCIVGVSNITKALKDGDLVEVDANKGIVKKIK